MQVGSLISQLVLRLHRHLHGNLYLDIKPDNIMFGFEDDSVLVEFEQAERDNPSPRKEINGRTIYLSRQVQKPRDIGPPVLCDFGAAHFGDRLNSNDVQPNQYRCPEVILDIPWGSRIDVWNIGCMIMLIPFSDVYR